MSDVLGAVRPAPGEPHPDHSRYIGLVSRIGGWVNGLREEGLSRRGEIILGGDAVRDLRDLLAAVSRVLLDEQAKAAASSPVPSPQEGYYLGTDHWRQCRWCQAYVQLKYNDVPVRNATLVHRPGCCVAENERLEANLRLFVRTRLRFDHYPVRVCRSLHHCEICGRSIVAGERYFDGGFTRRAHEHCVRSGGYDKAE